VNALKPKAPIDLWERMEAIERDVLIRRPPNSFTASEYAVKRGVSRSKASTDLYRLAKLGKVKRHKVPGSTLMYWTIA